MNNKHATSISHYDAFERMTFGRKIVNVDGGARVAKYVLPNGTVLKIYQAPRICSLNMGKEEFILV